MKKLTRKEIKDELDGISNGLDNIVAKLDGKTRYKNRVILFGNEEGLRLEPETIYSYKGNLYATDNSVMTSNGFPLVSASEGAGYSEVMKFVKFMGENPKMWHDGMYGYYDNELGCRMHSWRSNTTEYVPSINSLVEHLNIKIDKSDDESLKNGYFTTIDGELRLKFHDTRFTIRLYASALSKIVRGGKMKRFKVNVISNHVGEDVTYITLKYADEVSIFKLEPYGRLEVHLEKVDVIGTGFECPKKKGKKELNILENKIFNLLVSTGLPAENITSIYLCNVHTVRLTVKLEDYYNETTQVELSTGIDDDDVTCSENYPNITNVFNAYKYRYSKKGSSHKRKIIKKLIDDVSKMMFLLTKESDNISLPQFELRHRTRDTNCELFSINKCIVKHVSYNEHIKEAKNLLISLHEKILCENAISKRYKKLHACRRKMLKMKYLI